MGYGLVTWRVPPPKTNMTMENPPRMKMYFLLKKICDFPASHVSFPGGYTFWKKISSTAVPTARHSVTGEQAKLRRSLLGFFQPENPNEWIPDTLKRDHFKKEMNHLL